MRETPGDQIRRRRKRLDWLQSDLSAASGVAAATISRLENNKVTGEPPTLRALYHAIAREEANRGIVEEEPLALGPEPPEEPWFIRDPHKLARAIVAITRQAEGLADSLISLDHQTARLRTRRDRSEGDRPA